MDGHHAHLVGAVTIHVAAHLATTAAKLRQKAGQRNTTCTAEFLRQGQKMVQSFIHSRASRRRNS